jgi:hypothetical protein
MRHSLIALAAFVCLAQTPAAGLAQSSMPECTCRNLASLQEEYQNAVYLEGYMRRLGEHLRAVEARQIDMNKNDPTNKDAGISPNQASATARQAYADKNLRLPFPNPTGYTGPSEVSMTPGTCKQPAGKLAELEGGSPCQAIADAALAHEATHRAICEKLGADAYWSRMPSEIALEEADMYKGQAANLKAELRRVLDASDLRVVGEFSYHMAAGPRDSRDKITYDSGDLSLASQGGDRWEMTGTGDSVTEMVMNDYEEGVTCTTGEVQRPFSVSLETDGLTADVKLEGHQAKEVGMRCSNGLSVPMFGGLLGEQQVRRLRLVTGDMPFPQQNEGLLSMIVGAASAGGASMGTEQSTILRLTCEGQ